MNRFDLIKEEWNRANQRLMSKEFFLRLAEASLTRKHYVGFLKETYHNVAHNPKKMALFQANMETEHTALESKFLKHAAMEVGHDKLVLDDLRALGVDPEKVRQSRPLPTTEALTGFIVFQIEYRNPYAYLGYLYHLEALPTSIGEAAGKTLNKIGIPLGAQSFLKEHTEVDTVHMKWNQEYLEGFLRNEQDFEAVLYGLKGTCELHGLMFDSIMENYS